MSEDAHTTTMLGTYSLDRDVPVDPEIVLNNCADTNMLGQLVTVFQNNPDIRFFLIHDMEESAVDPASISHFVKDGGNWVLGNGDHIIPVMFDDASFNPKGTEQIFALTQDEAGNYAIETSLPPDVHMLVNTSEQGVFPNVDEPASSTFFIHASVLDSPQDEIVLNGFKVGSDTLQLDKGIAIKDVIFHSENDFTELIVGGSHSQNNETDVVVKLLGITQFELFAHEHGLDQSNSIDDLIQHMLDTDFNHHV